MRSGRTLSEVVRGFSGGLKYRRPAVAGFAVYLMLAAWAGLQGEAVYADWRGVRVAVLAAGVGLWLIPHWLTKGQDG